MTTRKISQPASERLSSTLNTRADVIAPRKEIEKAEKEHTQAIREAHKAFEKEKKALEKKLVDSGKMQDSGNSVCKDSGPVCNSRKTSLVPLGSANSQSPRRMSASQSAAQEVFRQRRSLFMNSLDHFEQGIPPGTGKEIAMSAFDRREEALRQLRYLHDTITQMVAESDAVAHMPAFAKTPISSVMEEAEAGSSRVPGPNHPVERKRSSRAALNFSDLRKISTATDDPDKVKRLRRMSTVQTNVDPLDEYPKKEESKPSQATQLISMIRAICMKKPLDTRAMKATTAVLDECRIAIKTIKSGMEPDKSQEKLIRKLNELMEIVKPLGGEIFLSPEEVLQCGYLRLSKDNVEQMEKLMREKGVDPGIHCHTDLGDLNVGRLMEEARKESQTTMTTHPADLQRRISVTDTKAGSPMDKRRTSKPDMIKDSFDHEDIIAFKRHMAS